MNKKKVKPGQKLGVKTAEDPELRAIHEQSQQRFQEWLKCNGLENEDFSRLDMEWYAECAWKEQEATISHLRQLLIHAYRIATSPIFTIKKEN